MVVNRVRAVVFDLDGVLIDTSRVWYAVQNDVARELGFPEVSFERFLGTFGQGTAADVDAFFPGTGEPVIDRMYTERFRARIDEIVAIDGARELLEELRRRGLPAALATNTIRPLAEELLERSGLRGGLDHVASASEVPRAKPDPDVLLLAIERLRMPKESVVYVGDTSFDELAANAAAVHFVGFRYGSGERIEAPAELVSRIG